MTSTSKICFSRLPGWLSTFRSDGRGNVAVIFSLSLLPMIGFVGLGVDYSRALSARTTLNAAADAAALAAATQAMANLQTSTGTIATAQTVGTQAAAQVFSVDATRVGQWIGGAPTPTVVVTPGTSAITATVSYQANVPSVFGRLFQTSQYSIGGSASSQLNFPNYINISVLTDISQSMGLAATQAGMTQLQQLTPDGCAFGCHVVSQDQASSSAYYKTTPYEVIAHTANPTIQLRIDVIRQATQSMIKTAQSMALSPPLISFGLYTLQAVGNGLNGPAFGTLSSPTTNYASLITAANGIDLGQNTSAGIGDTDDKTAMNQLSAIVPANGTGTAKAPLQYVFLMTDGVQDVWCSSGYGSHCTQAFDPTLCSTLKANKVTVGVIYTTYLAMPGDSRYSALVASIANQIAPNLTSCATPGWFYQASDAADIQTAINALFAKATSHGVLTQ